MNPKENNISLARGDLFKITTERSLIDECCIKTLINLVLLLQTKEIIAVSRYVERIAFIAKETLKQPPHNYNVNVIYLIHPAAHVRSTYWYAEAMNLTTNAALGNYLLPPQLPQQHLPQF